MNKEIRLGKYQAELYITSPIYKKLGIPNKRGLDLTFFDLELDITPNKTVRLSFTVLNFHVVLVRYSS